MNEEKNLAEVIALAPDHAVVPEGGSITYAYPQSSLRTGLARHGFWVWNANGTPARTFMTPWEG